ncbi:MAG: electron transfer flavoprotein subunit beta/FixA family protein, partial [Acidimicrobiales bacterium]
PHTGHLHSSVSCPHEDGGRWNASVGALRTESGVRFEPAMDWFAMAILGEDRFMNVVVCAKQIPDPAAPGSLDPSTHNLVRDGKLILDDSDAYGVEMGLQLAEEAGGGEVTLVSMAPRGETSGLRTALAMGAAKAILISDDAVAGSDALATAKILAKAIERAQPDLVLAATESTDGYTGTMPAQLAELLGLPSITFAKKVSVKDGTVHVQRQTESGYDEVECPLPAVVTVTAGVVEPRYPSFKGIMAAKSKPLEQVTASDLGLSAESVGSPGARQEVTDVAAAEERSAGEIVTDEGDGHERIVAFLEQLKLI